MLRLICSFAIAALACLPTTTAAADPTPTSVADDLAVVASAAAEMGVADNAQQAWRRLAALNADQLPAVLAGMKDAGPLAQNWLRTAVDAIAEGTLREGGTLPVDALNAFVRDTANAPRARQVAFDWLVRVDPVAKRRLLYSFLNDPDLSLRYQAVAQMLVEAESLAGPASDVAVDAVPDPVPDPVTKAAQINVYRKALAAARDFGQIEDIAGRLEKLGEEVAVADVLGFLKTWSVIGPFDNTDLAHFNTAYPPENNPVNAEQVYAGKNGEVSWKEATADTGEGFVDLAQALGAEKEAVAYATTVFRSAGGPAELRYQSKNATKVWLNGKLVAQNEVYHSGGGFDQYRVGVELRPGPNVILVKACQNKQLMPWERDWSFRLRLVDGVATPLQPVDGDLLEEPISTY